MQILPIDLTALVSVILGISVVLVPVIGLTARFALKPSVEALIRLFENRSTSETVQLLERRIDLQEQEIQALQTVVRGLSEARDFERQLAAPPTTTPTSGGAGPAGG
jgi:hypothetical protein